MPITAVEFGCIVMRSGAIWATKSAAVPAYEVLGISPLFRSTMTYTYGEVQSDHFQQPGRMMDLQESEAGAMVAEESTTPALVVTFGSTTRKRRALGKYLTIIGRSRFAEIRLEAPEVANVHCVICRVSDGFHIRDCDTRSGTLVNEAPIRDSLLRDGDALQVGPFTFRVSIPAGAGERSADPTPAAAAADASTRAESLAVMQARLDARQRELESRALEANRLENALRLRTEELEEHAARVDALQRELEEQRQTALQTQIQLEAERIELQRQRDEFNAQSMARESATTLDVDQISRDVRAELTAGMATLHAAKLAAEKECATLRQELAEANDNLRALKAAQADGAQSREWRDQELGELKEANERLRRELSAIGEDAEKNAAQVARELETERARVKQLIKDIAAQHHAARQEVDQWQQKVAELEAALRESQAWRDPASDGNLAIQADSLRQRVADLEQQLAEATRGSAEPGAGIPADLLEYEKQLNDYRGQLEQAQQEIESKNQELMERIKQAELDFSRQRAEMARDKSQVDRLLQELKTEFEKAGKDDKMAAQLASVRRLTQDMRDGIRQTGSGNSEDQSLAGRIRGMIRRLGDG